MQLTVEETAMLERDGVYVSNHTFRQCFEPYMARETMARFITSDSLLNAFQVLLEGTVKHLEERNAGRLCQALWSSWAALEGKRVARIVLGVALRLLEQEVDLGPVRDEVELEVERVRGASECLLPDWLEPSDPDLIGVDYRRFRVRGFYAGSPQLVRAFV